MTVYFSFLQKEFFMVIETTTVFPDQVSVG